MKEILNKIAYNVLSALYQPFWTALLIAFLSMFVFLYAKEKNTGANYRGEIQYQNCKLYTLDSYCRFYCLWQTVLHIMATDKVTGGDYNDSVYVGVDLYYISLFQSNSVAYDDKHRM